MPFGTFGIHNLKTDMRNLHLKSSMSFPFHTVHDSIDMSLSKLQKVVEDREVWCTAVHGVPKSQIRLSDWRTTAMSLPMHFIWIPKIFWLRWINGKRFNLLMTKINKVKSLFTNIISFTYHHVCVHAKSFQMCPTLDDPMKCIVHAIL